MVISLEVVLLAMKVFFFVDKVDVNPTKWWLARRVKLATLAQWKKDEKKTSQFRSQTKRGGSRNMSGSSSD